MSSVKMSGGSTGLNDHRRDRVKETPEKSTKKGGQAGTTEPVAALRPGRINELHIMYIGYAVKGQGLT